MVKNKRIIIICFIIVLISIILFMLHKKNENNYDINTELGKYDLNNEAIEYDYLNYLKNTIYPIKLRKFIDILYVNYERYKENATGKVIKNQMEFLGYKFLFNSMFDKERNDYNDCPVTDNFKKKFDKNLLYYFNLNESEDCGSMCSLNRKDKKIIVEVYGNFKNTEPTFWTKHHFHYTLDDEGNVDDVVFDYTDK